MKTNTIKTPNTDLFEEMNVVELEDRLELVDRCICRKGADATPVDG